MPLHVDIRINDHLLTLSHYASEEAHHPIVAH